MIEHSAATVLMAYMKSVGVFTEPSLQRPWPGFSSAMPDQPAQVGVILTSMGMMDGREQRTGRTVEHPGFQVMLRTPQNAFADLKGSEVIAALDAINRSVVVVGLKSYILHAIKRTSPMIPIGQEEGGGRFLFSLNGTLTYGES